jgi:superfamily I DNA/RNA helicase
VRGHGPAFGGASLGAAARKKLGAFVDLMDGLAGVRDGGATLAELLIQVVERSGYREFLEHDDGDGTDRMRNLAELVNVASDYQAEAEAEPDPPDAAGVADPDADVEAPTGASGWPGSSSASRWWAPPTAPTGAARPSPS